MNTLFGSRHLFFSPVFTNLIAQSRQIKIPPETFESGLKSTASDFATEILTKFETCGFFVNNHMCISPNQSREQKPFGYYFRISEHPESGHLMILNFMLALPLISRAIILLFATAYCFMSIVVDTHIRKRHTKLPHCFHRGLVKPCMPSLRYLFSFQLSSPALVVFTSFIYIFFYFGEKQQKIH